MDHVGVVVRDIDGALQFYLEGLGLALTRRAELPNVGVRLAFLSVGVTTLQLVEPTGPGLLATQLEERGEGLHHVCFRVPAIEPAIARLAPGAEVSIYAGDGGRRTCFLPGTYGGLRIELIEDRARPGAAS